MRSEVARHLLNHRGQDVVLELPLLDLNGHLDADHVTDHQGAPDIDAAAATELGHLNHLEPHLRQQLRDKLLELTGHHGQQPLAQGLPNLVAVLLHLERETAPHRLAQVHIATAVLDRARALTAFLLALDLGDQLGVPSGVRRLSASYQPSFLQSLLGDFLVVHRLRATELLKHFLSTIGEREARI